VGLYITNGVNCNSEPIKSVITLRKFELDEFVIGYPFLNIWIGGVADATTGIKLDVKTIEATGFHKPTELNS
jgi:hypothetical protein